MKERLNMDSDFQNAKHNNDDVNINHNAEDINDHKVDSKRRGVPLKYKFDISKPLPIIGLAVIINIGITLGISTLMSKNIIASSNATIEKNNQTLLHNIGELEVEVNKIDTNFKNISEVIVSEAELINIKNNLNHLTQIVNDHSNTLFEMTSDLDGKSDSNEINYKTITSLSIRLSKVEDKLNKLETKKQETKNVASSKKVTATNKNKKVRTTTPLKSQVGNYTFLNIDTWGDESVLVVSNNGTIERLRVGHKLKVGDDSWLIKSILSTKAKLTSGSKSIFIGE